MRLFRKKIKDPVSGTAQVVSCSMHRGDGAYQNCRLQLVVHVDGWQAYPAEVHQILPRKKWPQPGFSVPVVVSRRDPQRLKIDTDAMPTNEARAREIAQEQANWVNRPDAAHAHPAPDVHVLGDPTQLPPDKLAEVERMVGQDLDGDGVIGSVGGRTSNPTARADDDRIARLERLAQLHSSGALTDAEFAAEKARILGS